MQGRITERHLPLAEKSFPGIQRFYAQMQEKPATFLQLVWAYEGHLSRVSRGRRGPRSRRG